MRQVHRSRAKRDFLRHSIRSSSLYSLGDCMPSCMPSREHARALLYFGVCRRWFIGKSIARKVNYSARSGRRTRGGAGMGKPAAEARQESRRRRFAPEPILKPGCDPVALAPRAKRRLRRAFARRRKKVSGLTSNDVRAARTRVARVR